MLKLQTDLQPPMPPAPDHDIYELLNEAIAALPTHRDAVHQAVASLARLGLAGPARELITGARWGLLNRPEYRELLSRLIQAPSGRVAWSTLQVRFECNVRRLLECRPELAQHEACWREIPHRFELYRSLDGNHHLMVRGDDGILRGVGPLLDLRRMTAQLKLPHGRHAHTCLPYAICGDRFAAVLSAAFNATCKMLHSFAPRIYVIEPDSINIGVALYVCDDVESLCHPRVDLFIADSADALSCIEPFLSMLNADTQRELPLHVLGLSQLGEMQKRLLDGLRDLGRRRSEAAIAHVCSARDWYSSRSLQHWASRLGSDRAEPLRILGLTSRFTTVLQYAMRDLRAAFERRGHIFHTLIEPSDHDTLTAADITRTIDTFKPDLAIGIDHLRAGQNGLMPDGLPYVCWIQDLLPHLTNTKAGESVGLLEFFLAPELHQFVQTYHYPADRGIAWTLATNAELYDARRLPDAELAPHHCDVSYVSNQSQSPETFVAEYCDRSLYSDKGRILCAWLFERLRRDVEQAGGAALSATMLLREANQAIGIAPTSPAAADALARTFIHPLAELIFRHTTLRWVADYCEQRGKSFRLYGLGWESHPRLGRYACGVATNGAMLRAVYQASTINLQVIGSGVVHQRLLDGLAAGGFFLIRDCPIDRLHVPVSTLLNEIRQNEIKADHDYAAVEYPVLSAALIQARRCRGMDEQQQTSGSGSEAGPASIRISGEELGFYQELETTNYRRVAGAVFADYDGVSFCNRSQLFERLDQFNSDESARAAIARRMRQVVLERFTYDGLVDALLKFLSVRLNAMAHANPNVSPIK